jgi:hypothetical protein
MRHGRNTSVTCRNRCSAVSRLDGQIATSEASADQTYSELHEEIEHWHAIGRRLLIAVGSHGHRGTAPLAGGS